MNTITKYKLFKEKLLKYKTELYSETFGYEKINFNKIIDIQEILNLILNDERKGIHLLRYIDLTNISFDNQNVEEIDFTGTNATINPQKVKNRNLTRCILNGVSLQNKSLKKVITFNIKIENAKNINIELPKEQLKKDIQKNLSKILDYERIGIHILKELDLTNINFDNQNVEGIDFTDTNATINPQTVKNKSLKYTILPQGNYESISFKNTNIQGTNFKNTTNVKINIQKIKEKDIRNTILKGVDFQDIPFDNALVTKANFTGAKNINLDPQTLAQPTLYGCILNGINFKNKSFKGICIINTNFIGAKNVIINKNEVWSSNIEEAIFDKKTQIIGIETIKKNNNEQENEFQKTLTLHILSHVPTRI